MEESGGRRGETKERKNLPEGGKGTRRNETFDLAFRPVRRSVLLLSLGIHLQVAWWFQFRGKG